MRRKRKPTSLADSIIGALVDAGLTDQARRLRIYQAWDKAVGPEIAQRTAPDVFRRGVLLVKVSSATWQNELVFLKADILTKLNALLGDAVVRDLKIVSGKITREPPAPRRESVRPSSAQVAEARQTAEVIGDDELRDSFARMMAADLARRKT